MQTSAFGLMYAPQHANSIQADSHMYTQSTK